MRTVILGALVAAALPVLARAADVTVTDAWSRPAIAGHVGVAYFTVTDSGAPDQLTGVSSPVAGQAQVHQTTNDHGVMRMRAVTAVPVEPGKPVSFAPGGYHVMLIDLHRPLKTGDTFPLTLTFAHAGAVPVTVTVQNRPATSGGMGNMPGMDHMQGMGNMPGMAH